MNDNGQDTPEPQVFEMRIEASGTVGQGTGPPVPAAAGEDDEQDEEPSW